MLLDCRDPISKPCARTVEPAVDALLHLNIAQQEVVEQLARALGIVRCVLDYDQSIQRSTLTALGRSLWTQLARVPGLPPATIERGRSIIRACVDDIRLLPEPIGPLWDDLPAPDPAKSAETPCHEPMAVAPEIESRSHCVAESQQKPERAASDRPTALSSVDREDRACETNVSSNQIQFALPLSPNRVGRRNGVIARPTPNGTTRERQTFFEFTPNEPDGAPLLQQSDRQPPSANPQMPALSCPLSIRDSTTTDELRPAAPKVIIASGEKAKARDILAAVATLKILERENRPATSEERQALARFAGFGPVALSIFPDPVTGHYKDQSWQQVGEQLAALLTAEEYESTKRTTFNAFYTSPVVIAAMHDAIVRLGVHANATVLEPGCGTGNFLRYAPPGMRFVGIELDLISGRIAKLLHPEHDIRIENFRDSKLPEGSIDAVIGNVPFADVRLEYRGQKLALHDFFLAKAVDALRSGGALAVVTSHFMLDKQNAAIREYLATRADFVGAIRLPSDAFKREGTAVVTDIVFLRRRAESDTADHIDPDWLNVGPLVIDCMEATVNRYFLNHPEMVLGAWSRKDTLYGEGYSVIGNGELEAPLRTAIARLPEFSPTPSAVVPEQKPAFSVPPLEGHIGEASFFVADDGTICQLLDGRSVPVVYGGKTLSRYGAQTGKRLASLIRLRDCARRVLQSQNDGWPEQHRVAARRDLNFAYDRFTETFGPINKTTFGETKYRSEIRRMPNLVKFREDPDAMLVMSLEEYDEATGKAAKSAIMTKDVVGKKPPVSSVATAEDGLLVSLNERGTVALPFISSLYGKPQEQVITELGDLIFHDPECKAWQTADAYLSGNVRAKLAAVLNGNGAYARNAEALQQVQPEDVLPGDIDCNLGAPWIPDSDIAAFAADLLRVEASAITVGHVKQDAIWSIDANYVARESVAATSEFGTDRANGVWLLELALNMKTPVIYDTMMDGDRETRVVNQEATLAAREKQKQIKERFRNWIFSDPERTERTVRLYNDTYNNIRLRLFDGAHLDFPGMNQTIQLRNHQRDAIWRCMCAGNTLLAQTVGAGKTFIMAAAGMKMKQAGLIKKPLYVVPNHMLEQFGREFLQLYPNGKLLLAGKDDLRRDRRKVLTAKIASGEWDGIVVTHSSFERIGMSRGYQERFLRDQIKEYEELLCDGASKNASRAQRNLIKAIEKQKVRREERLKELLAEDKKDDGLVFDELGVDQLFIDEAQSFKNLETPTKMERVAGIQTGGSERAFDLFMKTRFLHEQHPGHGVTFATGTPISNTMVEMYTLQRYLDPAAMLSRGIDHFDAWAATFGEVVDTMEISPDGASLRPRSRFAKFTNLPELQQLFRAFSDVQTADMLDLPRPQLEGGKAKVVACPMSEVQRELQMALVARYERLRSQKVDPREDNALAITTDGRKLALDARLLSANATDFLTSKVNALVETVAGIWQTTTPRRSAQMVFCDLGVNPTAWGYSVYDEIIGKLCARNIPRAEVAVMGDADTDAKKQALFERVRAGQVRVLLGSTAKMGMGTNVQKRLVALHHLDAPWKPAEVEQREGRILRQGNENETVSIYRYVTEGSFDAYMWQALETKARFIAQVMTGENALRRAEDIGGHEFSYAEVKAIASGNPAVLTLAVADAELQRLAILHKNHADEQYLARRKLRELPQTIAHLSKRLSAQMADLATINAHVDDPLTIDDHTVARKDAIDVLGGRLEALPRWIAERKSVALGRYRGLRFGMTLDPHFAPDVFLHGEATRNSMLDRDHHGPRAVLNALERLAGSYESECDRIREELALAESQLRDYHAHTGRAFVHDSYRSALTDLRDRLKVSLSEGEPKGSERPVRSPSELADQITALKTAHKIEPAPQRLRKRTGIAAEPVTTRIRMRLEAKPT